MSGLELLVRDDPADAAAELLAHAARAGGHVALCGGSTAGPVLERAAALAPDWSAVEVWWGDDRAVPPSSELSNYRLAEERLLGRLHAAPRAVHRIEGELGADEAAASYDRQLAGVSLGLALNGIGPDGHTASLFPHGPELEAADRQAVAAEGRLEPFVPRVTLTIPAFGGVALLVFLVTGEAKSEAVRRAFAEPPSPRTPASLVRGRHTVALLDRAAAALLPDDVLGDS